MRLWEVNDCGSLVRFSLVFLHWTKGPVVGYWGSTIVERSHLARAAPETDKSLWDKVVDADTIKFSKTPTDNTVIDERNRENCIMLYEDSGAGARARTKAGSHGLTEPPKLRPLFEWTVVYKTICWKGIHAAPKFRLGLNGRTKVTSMHLSMPQLTLLSLHWLFPALDQLGLLQFVVFSVWLILKCGNTSPSLLARAFREWLQFWL